jgi:uncharacterized protein (TIGR01319 family)
MSDIRILIDFGSTFTKGVAFDLVEERLLARVQTPSTVDTDVTKGLENALNLIAQRVAIGDEEVRQTVACSSAAGGLRMICVGLVPDYTTKAGYMAALGAGAKVVGTFSYELTSTELEEIKALKPDIVLLTGGTDGGNKKIIAHNASMLAQIEDYIKHIIVAGNKSAHDDIAAALGGTKIEVTYTKNIMPEFGQLELDAVNEMIRDVFLGRITQAKGVAKVEDIIAGILMPTPSAVLEAAALLANGTSEEAGIGELLLVDVGGATTDVDSVARGIPTRDGVHTIGLKEPYAKRTVEGDLGMYHNIDSLAALEDEADEADDEAQVEALKSTLSIPNTDELTKRQLALSHLAVKTAVDRHVGRVEAVWTHDGDVWVQRGKDLTNVETIIGTGGPLAFSADPKFVLEGAVATKEQPDVLKPKKPRFLLDKDYIMFAAGLLAQSHPDKALRIMKKHLKEL